jgi:hypothetical protein
MCHEKKFSPFAWKLLFNTITETYGKGSPDAASVTNPLILLVACAQSETGTDNVAHKNNKFLTFIF